MKRLLAIVSVLMVVVLFTGCSLLPTTTSVKNTITPIPIADLFQYEGLDYLSSEVLVRADSFEDLESILSTEGSQLLKEWNQIGWALVSVPEGIDVLDFCKSLRKYNGILLVTPNMKYTVDAIPSAVQYDDQWGFKNIHAEPAWDITTGSSNVIVAIVDTGVDMNHTEFADKTFIAPYDATEGTIDVTDFDGHGTHVAGIAAASGRNGRIAGVAWDCPIMPIRVLDYSGVISTRYLIDAMLYLGAYAEQHPNIRLVANMSIGGREYDFAFKDAIDFAMLNNVLLITSAGNESKRVLNYPSAFNGVVSVAASTPWDVRADFSTIGSWNSVAAPGTRILSTLPNGGYESWDGTSMAAPFVTGAAALLLSKDWTLTSLEIKNQIEQTARGSGFSEELGYGILDIQALLGPIQPMIYGSLNVTTNIFNSDTLGRYGTGIITVFDANENMVTYGTTGESGNHIFHALKPGVYTVNVGYSDPITQKYCVLTRATTITSNHTENLDFTFAVSGDNNRILEKEIPIHDTNNASKEYNLTITVDGMYEIETALYTTECDTIITLYDANYLELASNDDYNKPYSLIATTLTEGTYFLRVSTYQNKLPLDCYLRVYRIEPISQ